MRVMLVSSDATATQAVLEVLIVPNACGEKQDNTVLRRLVHHVSLMAALRHNFHHFKVMGSKY